MTEWGGGVMLMVIVMMVWGDGVMLMVIVMMAMVQLW